MTGSCACAVIFVGKSCFLETIAATKLLWDDLYMPTLAAFTAPSRHLEKAWGGKARERERERARERERERARDRKSETARERTSEGASEKEQAQGRERERVEVNGGVFLIAKYFLRATVGRFAHTRFRAGMKQRALRNTSQLYMAQCIY